MNIQLAKAKKDSNALKLFTAMQMKLSDRIEFLEKQSKSTDETYKEKLLSELEKDQCQRFARLALNVLDNKNEESIEAFSVFTQELDKYKKDNTLGVDLDYYLYLEQITAYMGIANTCWMSDFESVAEDYSKKALVLMKKVLKYENDTGYYFVAKENLVFMISRCAYFLLITTTPDSILWTEYLETLSPLKKYWNADIYRLDSLYSASKGNYANAFISINKAIQLEPKSPYSYRIRGVLKGVSDDHKGATIDLKKAIELGDTESVDLLKDITSTQTTERHNALSHTNSSDITSMKKDIAEIKKILADMNNRHLYNSMAKKISTIEDTIGDIENKVNRIQMKINAY